MHIIISQAFKVTPSHTLSSRDAAAPRRDLRNEESTKIQTKHQHTANTSRETYNQILFMKPCMNLELWNYLQGIYIDLQLLMLYAELFY